VNFPSNLKYTKEHEWVAVDDDVATIGVTDHAQDALGDIVYLGDFPEVGDDVQRGDVIGVVESVKATSDIFAPISGDIVEINETLEDAPEVVNESPYDKGWLLKISVSDDTELDDLLDLKAYLALLSEDG
jgi:glycine cleavage system H protein